MSTKNLGYSSGGQLGTFLLISLVIHMAASLLMVNIGSVARLIFDTGKSEQIRPVVVDVIELPSWVKGNGEPQKRITRFADRTVNVDKEVIPGPSATAKPGSKRALSKRSVPKKSVPKTGTVAGYKRSGGVKKSTGIKKTPVKPIKPAIAPKGITGPPRTEQWSDPDLTLSPSGVPGGAADGSGASPMEPNLFLTDAQVAALTKRYEEERPSSESGKTLQLNTTELRYQSYLLNMKTRIELYWEYPILAVRNGWQGNLQMNFSIQEDGSIGEIEIANSSGYPVLDDSAKTALRLATPFPPFPENFDIEEININGRFEYKLHFAPLPNQP